MRSEILHALTTLREKGSGSSNTPTSAPYFFSIPPTTVNSTVCQNQATTNAIVGGTFGGALFGLFILLLVVLCNVYSSFSRHQQHQQGQNNAIQVNFDWYFPLAIREKELRRRLYGMIEGSKALVSAMLPVILGYLVKVLPSNDCQQVVSLLLSSVVVFFVAGANYLQDAIKFHSHLLLLNQDTDTQIKVADLSFRYGLDPTTTTTMKQLVEHDWDQQRQQRCLIPIQRPHFKAHVLEHDRINGSRATQIGLMTSSLVAVLSGTIIDTNTRDVIVASISFVGGLWIAIFAMATDRFLKFSAEYEVPGGPRIDD